MAPWAVCSQAPATRVLQGQGLPPPSWEGARESSSGEGADCGAGTAALTTGEGDVDTGSLTPLQTDRSPSPYRGFINALPASSFWGPSSTQALRAHGVEQKQAYSGPLSEYLLVLHSPSHLKEAFTAPLAFTELQHHHSCTLRPCLSKRRVT